MSINIAILGYGFSAKIFHIPFILNTPGLTLHSVVQRNPTDTNSVSQDHNTVKCFRSTEELYASAESSDISLVIITTSNATHFSYCKEALENGKHVVVEKPFTTSSKEADELVALAEKQGKVLTVFQSNCHHSPLITSYDFLGENQILTDTNFFFFKKKTDDLTPIS